MINGVLDSFSERPRVLGCYSGDQQAALVLQQFGGDSQYLVRRFAGAKDHFGEAFAERSMQVNLREAEIGHRRSLEGSQYLVAANAASAKFLEKFDGFLCGHGKESGMGKCRAKERKPRNRWWRAGAQPQRAA